MTKAERLRAGLKAAEDRKATIVAEASSELEQAYGAAALTTDFRVDFGHNRLARVLDDPTFRFKIYRPELWHR